MNHQDETRIDESLRDYLSLNIWKRNWILICQRFSRIWVAMIRFCNFESIAYRLFLGVGTIFAFFHSFGKYSFSKLCLKSKNKGFGIKEAHRFNMRMEIPSCPWALFRSKDLIMLVISSLEILNDEILSVVSKTKSLGRVLSFSIVLHCWVKNSISKFAFPRKLVSSLSLIGLGFTPFYTVEMVCPNQFVIFYIMSSLSDENVESKQDSETQINSNLLIVLNTSSSLTFSKLRAARLFRFQWQTKNLQLELVLLGPGFNSVSP